MSEPMFADRLTFVDFAVGYDDVYAIGFTANPDGTTRNQGVLKEMANAFDYPLTPEPDAENLNGLRRIVGRHKTLQDNIGQVQDALGTNDDAAGIAREWITRSALLGRVERSYLGPMIQVPSSIDVAIITGGVRNWMNRRAGELERFAQSHPVGGIVLSGDNTRVMREDEGTDVLPGMTEATYMEEVLEPRLGRLGVRTTVMKVNPRPDYAAGDEVALAAAKAATEGLPAGLEEARLLVVTNAGAWPMDGGQVRRAARSLQPRFDATGQQLFTVTDAFKLGVTGKEPKATHQNPLTALGMIPRNVLEFVRQQA